VAATPGPRILALDLGLTHAKAVVFDPEGHLVARASVPYATARPTPGRVEQDPGEWWSTLLAAVGEIRERSPGALEAVEVIGVTGHMHGLVLEDEDRRPIGPAIVLGDHRATAQAQRISEHLTPEWIARTTGATLDPSMPAAELRWIAENNPDALARAALITGPKDHLRGRLAGGRLTEPIDACATSLYDIRASRWSPELLDAAGVTASQLPDVVACESIAGPLDAEAAASLGMRPGTPVVVGAGDDVEILGGGVLDPGEALEHIGTTGSILAVALEPVDDPQLSIELYPSVLPDRWVLGGSMTTAGAALGWVADLLGYASIAEMLTVLGDGRLPGDPQRAAPIFVASMAGDRCPVRDPGARGAWVGLDTTVDRASLGRAAFAGVADALDRVKRSIEVLVGRQRLMVVSAGGSDLDPLWLGLRADTYGLPLVTLETPEPTALGLATVAAAGIGLHRDVRTAVGAMVRRQPAVDPSSAGDDRRLAEREAADRAVDALRGVWPALAGQGG
jgi:xylulokinase